jgi:hypothetical protein
MKSNLVRRGFAAIVPAELTIGILKPWLVRVHGLDEPGSVRTPTGAVIPL